MSDVVIIIGDPREKGFNRTLAKVYAEEMRLKNHCVHIFDLYMMVFKIEMDYGYKTERSRDILELEKAVEKTDLLVFTFPIWWYNMPAKLKGLVDQLFWIGKAYSFRHKKFLFKGPWRGKKARLIYTLGGTEIQHRLFGWSAYRAMRYPLWISGILSVRHTAVSKLDLPSRRNDHYYFRKIRKIAKQDSRRLKN